MLANDAVSRHLCPSCGDAFMLWHREPADPSVGVSEWKGLYCPECDHTIREDEPAKSSPATYFACKAVGERVLARSKP